MAELPASHDKPDPPFGPPDCPWEPMSSGSDVPETIFDCDGELNGERAYIGRVYDNGSYVIGTAVPSKGICYYVTKDLKVATSDDYEILTISCGDPLEFIPADWESNLLFIAGGDQDRLLYCGRVVKNGNTFFGWADNVAKTVHIPQEGECKVSGGYEILIHRYLDRLCICPTPPVPPPF